MVASFKQDVGAGLHARCNYADCCFNKMCWSASSRLAGVPFSSSGKHTFKGWNMEYSQAQAHSF
eukprot:1147889-Pelagomonas_calceolata.AAC.2